MLLYSSKLPLCRYTLSRKSDLLNFSEFNIPVISWFLYRHFLVILLPRDFDKLWGMHKIGVFEFGGG